MPMPSPGEMTRTEIYVFVGSALIVLAFVLLAKHFGVHA
jgi:hypothetical protein